MTPSKYEIGQQPCHSFRQQMEGNEYGMWGNVHECIYCTDSTVSYCSNCRRDHHANGYETCERKARTA